MTDHPVPADPPSPLTAKVRAGAALAAALMAANYPGDSGEDVDRLLAELAKRGYRLQHDNDDDAILRAVSEARRDAALASSPTPAGHCEACTGWATIEPPRRCSGCVSSPAPAELDVERLARALAEVFDKPKGPYTMPMLAEIVASEYDARAATPAGLDVERLRVAMTTFVRHRRPNVSANGFTEALEAPSPEEVAAEYDRLTRATTRPAEDEQ